MKAVTEVFADYETASFIEPTELHQIDSGFWADEKYLYGFRSSQQDVPIGATGHELLNGKKPGGTFNATEGHGLYIANTPEATKVPGVTQGELYCVRTPLHGKTLNTLNPGENLTLQQRKAVALHHLRSRVIGVPNPGNKNWDKLYQDADLVVFRPMAMARICLLASGVMPARKPIMPPVWGLVRDPCNAEVIAKLQKPR